jgi:hypothetical protein
VYEYPRASDSEPPLLVGVSGGEDSHELVGTCGTGLGGEKGVRGAVSADGRTVYFIPDAPCASGSGLNTGKEVPVRELYARVDGELGPEEAGKLGLSQAHTVAISQPDAPETTSESPPDDNCTEEPCLKNIAVGEPGKPNPSWRDAGFVDASEDGSKVFFLDTQQLTNEATEGTGNASGSASGSDCRIDGGPGGDCNLYMYDFDERSGYNLIDVSAGDTSGGGPQVREVEAVSSDGSHVYFVALGKLADNRDALGAEAVAGEGNLYVYERDARYPQGHTAFIASLPSADYGEGEAGDLGPNVTPEGRFLVFASHGVLTPGDTRGDGSAQIFRYDAETEQLVRVSIGSEGFDDNGNADTGDAHIALVQDSDRRGDPTMSNDGSRVFFQSPIGLTPKALDDFPIGTKTEYGKAGPYKALTYAENVYEWEQEGVGSCPAGHVAGCTYLISDGRDTAEAGGPESAVTLIGSDASGDNVFFRTADQLAPADTDTEVDIYDARVCEPEGCIAEPTPPLPPCLGEQCHGIPAATPSLLAPGTASFNGEGNITGGRESNSAVVKKPLTRAQKLTAALKACGKDRKKAKRASCERTARKNFGPVKKARK